MVIGGVSAAYLAGTMIGSAAVATGRYLAGGTSIADAFTYALSIRVLTPTIKIVLQNNPQVVQPDHAKGQMLYWKVKAG